MKGFKIIFVILFMFISVSSVQGILFGDDCSNECTCQIDITCDGKEIVTGEDYTSTPYIFSPKYEIPFGEVACPDDASCTYDIECCEELDIVARDYSVGEECGPNCECQSYIQLNWQEDCPENEHCYFLQDCSGSAEPVHYISTEECASGCGCTYPRYELDEPEDFGYSSCPDGETCKYDITCETGKVDESLDYYGAEDCPENYVCSAYIESFFDCPNICECNVEEFCDFQMEVECDDECPCLSGTGNCGGGDYCQQEVSCPEGFRCENEWRTRTIHVGGEEGDRTEAYNVGVCKLACPGQSYDSDSPEWLRGIMSCEDKDDGGAGKPYEYDSGPIEKQNKLTISDDCSCEGAYSVYALSCSNKIYQTPVRTVYTVDYDTKSYCLEKCTGYPVDWDNTGLCCGDDEEDCNKISGPNLCWKSQEGEWYWKNMATNKGEILQSGCSQDTIISNGIQWLLCTDTFRDYTGTAKDNPLKVVNSYICSQSIITECCGDSSCKSTEEGGGERRETGAVIGLNEKIYYCTDDLYWSTDLDTKTENSCESAGFHWTGSKCCSEADDPNEYYNDNVHGCWDSNFILSGDMPREQNDVINYDGQFYGCNIEAQNYKTDNEWIISLEDYHTGEPLIEDLDYCETLAGGYAYCSYTEEWETSGAEQDMSLSYDPNITSDDVLPAECCPVGDCFDGKTCVENMAYDASIPKIDGYRCVDGVWTNTPMFLLLSGEKAGWCPREDQCLVDLQGDADENDNPESNPQCIADTQYIKDDYCENGKWASRTKQLAAELLKIPSGDYTLFCGSYQDALNILDYVITSGKVAQGYVLDKTNNYCILQSGGKIIFGTTLNQDVEEGTYPFEQVLGVDCSGVDTEDGEYYPCSSSNVWYNKKERAIIYSPDTLSLTNSQDAKEIFDREINDEVDTLINGIKINFEESEKFSETADFLQYGFNKFKNVYLNKKGSRKVVGVMEGYETNDLAIMYEGFSTDICQIIDLFGKYKNKWDGEDLFSGIICKKSGDVQYVWAHGGALTFDPNNYWPDLTAKIRIA